jgi:hypothetical protein
MSSSTVRQGPSFGCSWTLRSQVNFAAGPDHLPHRPPQDPQLAEISLIGFLS